MVLLLGYKKGGMNLIHLTLPCLHQRPTLLELQHPEPCATSHPQTTPSILQDGRQGEEHCRIDDQGDDRKRERAVDAFLHHHRCHHRAESRWLFPAPGGDQKPRPLAGMRCSASRIPTPREGERGVFVSHLIRGLGFPSIHFFGAYYSSTAYQIQ